MRNIISAVQFMSNSFQSKYQNNSELKMSIDDGPLKRNVKDWLDEETLPSAKRATIGETPIYQEYKTPGATPVVDSTPIWGATPLGATPINNASDFLKQAQQVQGLSSTEYANYSRDRETYLRNRPWTDDELDEMLPSKGYEIVQPPSGYEVKRKLGMKNRGNAVSAPTPIGGGTPLYNIQEETYHAGGDLVEEGGDFDGIGLTVTAEGVAAGNGEGLPFIKAEDMKFFGKLTSVDTDDNRNEMMTADEEKEREIMKLLLQIKNGLPPQRKVAMREITQKAKVYGPGPLLDQILPLLMSRTLDDLERHLLVKVLDRTLFKLGDKVRPYAPKILSVLSPGLNEEDRFVRAESREVLANLSKAVGSSTMISVLRPSVDSPDEQVRASCARSFSIVASTLGLSSVYFFMKALMMSSSWQPKHTCCLMVRQLAMLMGSAVLPSLRELVKLVQPCLEDNSEIKVRTAAILAVASLAEAATPFGFEAFVDCLPIIWMSMRVASGRSLACLIRAAGSLLPLMDTDAVVYAEDLVKKTLVKQFASNDDEMRRVVLKVLHQVTSLEVLPNKILEDDSIGLISQFFRHFWTLQTAMDRRASRAVMTATLTLGRRTTLLNILNHLTPLLKDRSPIMRRLVHEAITGLFKAQTNAFSALHSAPKRLEESLVDGLLVAFNSPISTSSIYDDRGGNPFIQTNSQVLLNCFEAVFTLGLKHTAAPYLPQIALTAKYHLAQADPKIRQQSASLLAKLAPVFSSCSMQEELKQQIQTIYEMLGEEYPDVLGALLSAMTHLLKAVGNVRVLTAPPPQDLLPRLVPILKNRHESVQENGIRLVGLLAKTGGDLVAPREWDRVCFDLLETLKTQKKSIRQAAIHTFGHIARAIGPHDVMATLLSNLKVQERQLRVCTTVAIAVVAQACGPYTVLPALLNEYKVPDSFVRNGVLKSLCFLFEHIGEAARDYTMTVIPLLEDALQDRDPIHRQTASWAIKHLSIGVAGHGMMDAMVHLLNLVWPNLFETTAHLTPAFFDALDAFRLSVGPGLLFLYCLQGLFHPAQRVRTAYWRIYNQIYIGNTEQLVAFYPPLPADSETVKELPRATLQGYLPLRGASSASVRALITKPGMRTTKEGYIGVGEVTSTSSARMETRVRRSLEDGTTLEQAFKALPAPAPRPTLMSMLGKEGENSGATEKALNLLQAHLKGGSGGMGHSKLNLIGKVGEYSLRTYERSELLFHI